MAMDIHAGVLTDLTTARVLAVSRRGRVNYPPMPRHWEAEAPSMFVGGKPAHEHAAIYWHSLCAVMEAARVTYDNMTRQERDTWIRSLVDFSPDREGNLWQRFLHAVLSTPFDRRRHEPSGDVHFCRTVMNRVGNLMQQPGERDRSKRLGFHNLHGDNGPDDNRFDWRELYFLQRKHVPARVRVQGCYAARDKDILNALFLMWERSRCFERGDWWKKIDGGVAGKYLVHLPLSLIWDVAPAAWHARAMQSKNLEEYDA